MSTSRKPRTVTGRVALRLLNAVRGSATEANRMGSDLEYVFMLVCAQATKQGLQPIDLDNDQGTDALHAIFLMVRGCDRELIHVTPEWRRVVIAARARTRWPPNNLRPPPKSKWRNTRSSSDDLDLRTSS